MARKADFDSLSGMMDLLAEVSQNLDNVSLFIYLFIIHYYLPIDMPKYFFYPTKRKNIY